ncbi:MAG: 7-carboxy-7-deazaguanine synthase QueE [Cyclobacteriaceae bacterium]|nr:7-carboxy-7-deazaguanine synthase QueE [Cyclobacteriaceae bacterium HetDA_MAG_MS6]
MESFLTVQGEGFHTGRAAYFVRTAGCDVGCHWCDVKESWDASKHLGQSVKEIVDGARDSGAEVVVITGGEPLMYDLELLTNALQSIGLRTHLETSGAYPLTGSWDWICFSPKKFKKPLPEFYKLSSELKIVLYHKSDYSWAEDHASRVSANCQWFLQPEWSKEKQLLPDLIQYVKDNPKWRVSLQTHKYMDIP